jgi:hypothetical protein
VGEDGSAAPPAPLPRLAGAAHLRTTVASALGLLSTGRSLSAPGHALIALNRATWPTRLAPGPRRAPPPAELPSASRPPRCGPRPNHRRPAPPSLQVLWIPSSDKGCFNTFVVNGKDTATGAALETQKSTSALRATFSDLTPGAVYEFSVQATGPAGASGTKYAKVAMPPSTLDVTPDAPEGVRAVGVEGGKVKVLWSLPPGNPKVDSYAVRATPVNATG